MEDILSDVSSLEDSSLPNLNNDPLALKLAKRSSNNGSIAEGTFLADAGDTSKIQNISGKVKINQTLEEMFPRIKRDKKLWAKSLQNSKKSDQSDTSDFSFCVDGKNNILKNIQPNKDLTVNLTFSDSENDTFSNNENILRKFPLKNKYSVKIDFSDTESSLEESINIKNPFRKPFNPKIDLSLNITKDLSRTSDQIDISNQENLDSVQNDFSSDECINVNATRDLTMDEPRKSATFIVSNLSQNATLSKNETIPHNLTNENNSTFISSNDTFTIDTVDNIENRVDLSNYEKERYMKNIQENVINSTQDKSLVNIVEKGTKRVSKNEETFNKTGKNKENDSCPESLHNQENELNCTQNIAGNEVLKKTENMSEVKDVSRNEKTPNKREKRKGNKSKIDVCPESIQDVNELNRTYDIAVNENICENNEKLSNIDGCPESSHIQIKENGLNCTQNNTGNEEKLNKSCINKGKQKETPYKKEKNKLNSSSISGCPGSSRNIQEVNELCTQDIAGNDEKRNKILMKNGKQAETSIIKEKNNQNKSSPASSSNIQGEENELCTQDIAGDEEKRNQSLMKKGKQAETSIIKEKNNQNKSSPASSSNIQGEENELCTQDIAGDEEKRNQSLMKKGKQAETSIIKEKNNQNKSSPASSSNIQGEENELCTQDIAGNDEKRNNSLMKNGKQAETSIIKEKNNQNKSSSPASSSNIQGEENDLCTQDIAGNDEKLSQIKNKKRKIEETPNKKEKHNRNSGDIARCLELSQGEKHGLDCTQIIAGNEEILDKSATGGLKTPNIKEKNKLNKSSNISRCPESTRNFQEEVNELNCTQNIAVNEEKLNKSFIKKGKQAENQNKSRNSPASSSNIEENELCTQNISRNDEKRNEIENKKRNIEETPNKKEKHKRNSGDIARCLKLSQGEKHVLDCPQIIAGNEEKLDKSATGSLKKAKSKLNKSNGCSESSYIQGLNGAQNNCGDLTGHRELNQDDQEEMELDYSNVVASNDEKQDKSVSKNENAKKQNLSGRSHISRNGEKLDKSRTNKTKDDSKTSETRLKKIENNEQNKTVNLETTRNKKGKENQTSNISINDKNPEKSIITRSKHKQTPENLKNVSNKKLKTTKDQTSKNTDNELSYVVRNLGHTKNSLYAKETPYENDVFPLCEYIENKELKRPTITDVDSPKEEFTKPKRITRSASKNKGKSINDSSYETDIDISSIYDHNPRKKLLIYHSTPINKVPINSNTTDESLTKESNKFTSSQNLLSESMSGIQDLPNFEPIEGKKISVDKTNAPSINNSTMEISNACSIQNNETMKFKSKSLMETTRKTRSSSKTFMTQCTTDISSSFDDSIMDSTSKTDTNAEETKIRMFNKPQKRDSVFGVETAKTKKPKNNQVALPKLYKPVKWINKKFYDNLQVKLEAIHKLKTRKVSEEFAILLYHTYTLIMHGHEEAIDALKLKSKEIGLCENNMDFFMFIYEYTPFEFRRLVLPLGGAYGSKCSSVKIGLYDKL